MTRRLLAKHKHASRLENIAHAGYAARGVVYLLIGVLALMAAFGGAGGQTMGAQGALRQLRHTPGGEYMLAVVVAGLVGFAAWRLIQGLLDADGHGTGGKGLVVRIGLLVSGAAHLFLAFFAVGILAGWTYGGGGGSSGTLAQTMAMPYGRWIGSFIGLLIIGAGVAQIVKGYRAGFLRHMEMPAKLRGWPVRICRVGLLARGVVFCLIGGFLVIAAWQQDVSRARGLGGVLSALHGQPLGAWLLAILAVGLLAFSFYSFIEAGYRHIGQPRSVKQATPG